jgi:nitrite reductase/ring-hydroxylating ferredoxin subunit
MTQSTTPSAVDLEVVGHLDDFTASPMKVVRVGGRRVLLVRTSNGVFALDNACPHQGYGLALGDLADSSVTCVWHNWKFDVRTGACLVGEEDVVSHGVHVNDDGVVRVSITTPSPEAERPRLLTSLRNAVEKNYVGQMSRDTVRLLKGDANPGELAWEAIEWGAPRSEFGWGHAIAMTADCLRLADEMPGLERALPIVQALSAVSEEHRGERLCSLPDPVTIDPLSAGAVLRAHIEHEALENAQAVLLGAIHGGVAPAEIRSWLIGASSDHFLSYGHGAIYTQKAFELLDRLGWERADTVLGYLVPALIFGTREDRLPYMKVFMRAMGSIDLEAIAALARDRDSRETHDDRSFASVLLQRSDPGSLVKAATHRLLDGASVDDLLDDVVTATGERMLRFRESDDLDLHDDFGWLDMTHGITLANAARWQWRHAPGPASLRQVFFAVWLAHWTGRHEWHTSIGPRVETTSVESLPDLAANVIQSSLVDRTGSFIVTAHAIKTSVAARDEAQRTGSPLALHATARFVNARKMERFVARSVTEAQDFLSGRASRDA